ncbi:flagellar basal body rod protein FlgC [Spartinivicinus ruber]|uniref:flagellar basal body rod protein FlgC n=1 Tax=Spartinivicinus ruber TaxID=2683272 RepID=UPI0013D505E6|nr:flagellar basal body rod protein FlgC [Spartinivicinus ruber]
MALVNVFNIAGSGMSAQSVRINTVASNIANAETVSSSIDQTYRARYPVFTAISPQQQNVSFNQLLHEQQPQTEKGVMVKAIVESKAPLQRRYEPEHPMANDEGYVFYPNINVVEQMTDMISASRSFQTNVEIMNTAKTMLQKVLTLGQ